MVHDHLERVAAVPFLLGRPEDLPGCAPSAAALDFLAATDRMLALGAHRSSLAAMSAAIAGHRRRWPVPPSMPVDRDHAESAANRDNDENFGIRRVQGDPLLLLGHAALSALDGLLGLAARRGLDVPRSEWRSLVGGFDLLFAWLANADRSPRRRRTPTVAAVADERPDDALRCWVRGHHVFMVLAQGGGTALAALRAGHERGDVAGAHAGAAAATGLMDASRGALLCAGDARRERYLTEIRPTLMPPLAPPQMSGLHWRDHEYLIRELRRSRPAWQWLDAQRPGMVAAYRTALTTAYNAHRGVCAHFVGDSAPSLLPTSTSARPATTVLAQVRDRRIRLVPPDDTKGSPL